MAAPELRDSLGCRDVTFGAEASRASFSLSKVGIRSNMRIILNAISAHPLGRMNLKSPPFSRRETHTLATTPNPALSTWFSSARFNSSLRTPVVISLSNLLLSKSVSPSLMVARPRRSTSHLTNARLQALTKSIIVDARFYRLAPDRFLTHQKV